MPVSQPSYLQITVKDISASLLDKFKRFGLDLQIPLIAIHASAAKDYKKWPTGYYAELISILNERGYQPVLIGAGSADQQANHKILDVLKDNYCDHHNAINCIDLCNQLSLFELASLLIQVKAMIGNDSGPFHLAAALGIKGCVIFGPTDVELWRPLSQDSFVLKGNQTCAPECTKIGCIYDNRCLKSIKPSQVMENIESLL